MAVRISLVPALVLLALETGMALALRHRVHHTLAPIEPHARTIAVYVAVPAAAAIASHRSRVQRLALAAAVARDCQCKF